MHNQRLAVNGIFHASSPHDAVANAIAALGQQALEALPEALRQLPQDQIPLRAFDTVGLPSLRALFSAASTPPASHPNVGTATVDNPMLQSCGSLAQLTDQLAAVAQRRHHRD